MNITKIDWATASWNPLTGCRHGCPYCYARRTAHRFDAGLTDLEPHRDGLHVLEQKIKGTPYPYGFEPTLHRYRLDQPVRKAERQTVFVCSMADLFGRWVPTSWIRDVLDACERAPQHRYLFLTKNPARYLELDRLALLPHGENFWYGSTVANEDAAAMYSMPQANINTFWSMEPLLGQVDMAEAKGLPAWVILGAETGNRRDKVVPRREWVDQIAAFCAENEIPVFYKENLREHFRDLPASAFPWEIGYTVEKERWLEAARNLDELGKFMAIDMLIKNIDGRGQEDADDLIEDITLARLALGYVAEFAVDKCRFIPIQEGGLK